MPYDGPMPDADILLIQKWISLGALGAQCYPDGVNVCGPDENVHACDDDGNLAARRAVTARPTACINETRDQCKTPERDRAHERAHRHLPTRECAVKRFVAALGSSSRVAHAYPQYQLDKEQTCSGCHVSPAGGGLLNENGLATAESFSQLGTKPEFFYGKVPTPDWLELGGDLRGASGYLRAPTQSDVTFPMQAEVYAHAKLEGASRCRSPPARRPRPATRPRPRCSGRASTT